MERFKQQDGKILQFVNEGWTSKLLLSDFVVAEHEERVNIPEKMDCGMKAKEHYLVIQ